MINTRIIEVKPVEGKLQETEIGWVQMPEVPVEKRAPVQREGEPPAQPIVIKIGGKPFWVIGHTWDLTLTPSIDAQGGPNLGPKADSDAVLVLVVQAVPEMPSGLVRAGPDALRQLERMMAPPGGANN